MGSVFAVKLEMRKTNTLLELKQKIGELFDLKVNDFTVKRYMVSRELKDLHSKLISLGITNGVNLQVTIGKAH